MTETKRNFMELLRAKWRNRKFLCVGLDPDPKKNKDLDTVNMMERFIQNVIDETSDHVCVFKPNYAFYESYGPEGIEALDHLIYYIHETVPDVPVILDAKRADIGNTNNGSVKAFEELGADAITVNPYFGQEGLQPFLDQKDKGIIVLCRTSNKGAGEFQGRYVEISGAERAFFPEHLVKKNSRLAQDGPEDSPTSFLVSEFYVELYQLIAARVAHVWNKNRNCFLVVGATAPEELRRIREIAPEIPLLIPGVGAQGGDPAVIVPLAMDSKGEGFIVNASSSILYPDPEKGSTPYAEAVKLHLELGLIRDDTLAEQTVENCQ